METTVLCPPIKLQDLQKSQRKGRQLNLQGNISEKFRSIITSDHHGRPAPISRAYFLWRKISSHIEILVGPEIHRQWFRPITPIVISHDILILKTESTFANYWLNTQYQGLVESLLGLYDPNLYIFFMAPSDFINQESHLFFSPDLEKKEAIGIGALKSSASQIDC